MNVVTAAKIVAGELLWFFKILLGIVSVILLFAVMAGLGIIPLGLSFPESGGTTWLGHTTAQPGWLALYLLYAVLFFVVRTIYLMGRTG